MVGRRVGEGGGGGEAVGLILDLQGGEAGPLHAGRFHGEFKPRDACRFTLSFFLGHLRTSGSRIATDSVNFLSV